MRIFNYLKREHDDPGAKVPEENSADLEHEHHEPDGKWPEEDSFGLERKHPEPSAKLPEENFHGLRRKPHDPGSKKPAENGYDRAARKTAWATVAIATLTGVIGGAGIAQWIVLRGQLEAMRGQLDEMKSAGRRSDELIKANGSLAEAAIRQANVAAETARASQNAFTANQRAWLGPRNARITGAPKLSEPVTIILEYQNTGREPATNFTHEVESFTATREDEKKSGLRRTTAFMTKCMSASDVSHGQVVYPSSGSNSYSLVTRLDKKLIDENVVSGDKVIFLQGCFIYQSMMAVHHSYFCYTYKDGDAKSGSGSMSICNSGHNAD